MKRSAQNVKYRALPGIVPFVPHIAIVRQDTTYFFCCLVVLEDETKTATPLVWLCSVLLLFCQRMRSLLSEVLM